MEFFIYTTGRSVVAATYIIRSLWLRLPGMPREKPDRLTNPEECDARDDE